jgi:hypothetical protein
MPSSGMLRLVAVVRTDVLEQRIADSCHPDDRGAVPPKHRYLQEPHGLASGYTPFFLCNEGFTTSDWPIEASNNFQLLNI